jgi:uncharacterized protein
MKMSPVSYSALCLTHNCNLRCRYCYAGDKVNRRMSSETARAALDFLAGQSESTSVVTFFGGEPLLEFDLIRECVEYGRRKFDRRIEYRMSTNGTLLSPEILSFLKENRVYFVLSIDGHREQHDRARFYADGRGSHDKIVKNLKEILSFNPYTFAVSVIVPETVEFMAKGVKYLFDQGFRYVLQTLDYSAPWDKEQLKTMKKQYDNLATFYYESIVEGKKIFYSPFDERIKTHAQKRYGRGDLCDLANSQIAIAPSGRIYPCVQFIGTDDGRYLDNVIGDVETGFDEGRRRYFIEQNYLEKETCRDCTLHGRCATFCGCVNWRATGRLDLIPPIICEHERMLMPIVDRLANKLWKKNNVLFKRKFYEKTFPVSSYIEDCLIMRRGTNAQNQAG